MAVYIHIPFCDSKCGYCAFFSKANAKSEFINNYIDVLANEIRNNDRNLSHNIKSIYFGGGSPSILNIRQIVKIFETLNRKFDLSNVDEITFEANPEHLNKDFVNELKNFTPINRLSIGIQSFFQEDLDFLFRTHKPENAHKAIENALNIGFDNLTLDFIYGMPTLTDENLRKNLEIAVNYGIEHLSCYSLTIEENTILSKRNTQLDENKLVSQYFLVHNFLAERNFEHYETSNFAKNKKYSRHNLNYWQRGEYLGFGASAHSFVEEHRYWNVSDIERYSKLDTNSYNFEVLTEKDKYNEYIMTSIRTMWGIDTNYIRRNFPQFEAHFKQQLSLINIDWLVQDENTVKTSLSGSIFADLIAEKLFA